MSEKVVLITDPGIDGAFACTLALLDPSLEVLGVIASAGNVTAEQATRNVHILIDQLDPPRLPRLGEALPIHYDVDGAILHGQGGLGGIDWPFADLHHPHPGDKLLVDLARQHPGEITLLLMSPATVLANALDRDPELPRLLKRVIFVGGAWHDPGNASAVAEFHFYCDPLSTRQVLRAGFPMTLVPLDVSRKLLLPPAELSALTDGDSRAGRFLSRIIPFGLGATAQLYGIEGFHLKDVAGVLALAQPKVISSRSAVVDVETAGELTRGMCVVDVRWVCKAQPNVDLANHLDVKAAKQYLQETLAMAE